MPVAAERGHHRPGYRLWASTDRDERAGAHRPMVTMSLRGDGCTVQWPGKAAGKQADDASGFGHGASGAAGTVVTRGRGWRGVADRQLRAGRARWWGWGSDGPGEASSRRWGRAGTVSSRWLSRARWQLLRGAHWNGAAFAWEWRGRLAYWARPRRRCCAWAPPPACPAGPCLWPTCARGCASR